MKFIIKVIGNFIWKIFGGVWLASIWIILGIALTFTIIGFPLAVGCFKIGWLCWKPTNKKASIYVDKFIFFNIIWFLSVGWIVVPFAIVSSILHILTIFGIPLITQWFKVVKICLFPFGAIIK